MTETNLWLYNNRFALLSITANTDKNVETKSVITDYYKLETHTVVTFGISIIQTILNYHDF